jgi:hypothetical protein
MSKQQWPEPRPDWMPLGRAVFAIGSAEDGRDTSLHDKPLDQLTETELAKVSTIAFSPWQLAKMLRDESGAQSATIDASNSTFSFQFAHLCIGGAPWTLIEGPQPAPIVDPRLEAEAAFNWLTKTTGIVKIGEEEAAQMEETDRAVRKAAGLVWRHMHSALDRAVSTGAVAVYARIGSVLAPFERLPADVWRLLEIADWQNGVAVAPEGSSYWSIHVQLSGAEIVRLGEKRAGRPPKVDWNGSVKRKLFKLLDENGAPMPGDPEWSSQADVERAVQKMCNVPVAESTIRENTSRLIDEWRKSKAGN